MEFDLPSKQFLMALNRLVRAPLEQADVGVLVEAALAYWYTDFDLEPEILSFLATAVDDIEIRRAGYFVEKLSQFSCATDWRAANAMSALEHLRRVLLADVVLVPPSKRYDLLALSWGLSKGLGLKVQALLPYQTRHFEATQRSIRDK